MATVKADVSSRAVLTPFFSLISNGREYFKGGLRVFSEGEG